MSRRAEVEVAPMREAFQRSGMTLPEVAVRCGWYRTGRGGHKTPDSTQVAKTLGLKACTSHGHRYYQQTTNYETAVQLARALEMWPVDAGV